MPVLAASIAAALSAGSGVAYGAEADLKREIEELRRQNDLITQRLQELERRSQAGQAPAVPAPAAAATPPLSPEVAQRVADLEKRQSLVEEQQKNADQKALDNVYTGRGTMPRSWTLPGTNTSIRLGGFVGLDSIYDIGFAGGTSASFSGIPMSGTARANRTGAFQMHAQNSRLYFDLRSPSKTFGPLRAYVDMDFSGRVGAVNPPATAVATAAGNPLITNSYIPRLRYAYMDGGGFTVGQTDTTFVDVAAAPFFFDPSGPTGQTKIRQGLVRYTMPLGERTSGANPIGTNLQFSVENPEGDYTQRTGPASSALSGTTLTTTSNSIPDLHARINFDRSWGHLSAAGLVRKIRIDDGAGNKPSTTGWGLMSAFAIPTWGKDRITGQVVYGDGIGRYIPDAVNSGATSPSPSVLNKQTAFAAWLSYQHWWSSDLRSVAAIGATHVKPNPGDVPAALVQTDTQTFHSNLVYSPSSIPDLLLGVEYTWGKRELLTGQTGYLRRLSASAWYFF